MHAQVDGTVTRIHHERGSVRIKLGRLWLIRCALKHPNRWMIAWRRGLPEWDPTTSGRWKTLPTRLTEADRREFGVERAGDDEPDKVRLLEAFAPLACFQCNHPNALKARREIIEIIRAIRHREPLQGDLPVNCCRRSSGVGDLKP